MDPPLTLALYFRLRSSWRFKLPGPDFTNRFINSSIMFAFHRSLKIRIIRPRNRTAFTRSTIRLIYFANVHTCDVSSHMIKIEAFMADDSRSCILDSFPGEKRHKEAFKAPCICFNELAEAFRRYSEKSDLLAVSYPLNLSG